MQNNILIVGAGNMGSALGVVLSGNSQNSIAYWDKDETKIDTTKTLEEKVLSARIVFICVPSWHIRSAMEDVHEYLTDDVIICSLTKGVETHSNTWIPDFLRSYIPLERIAVLSGPMLSHELLDFKPTRAMLASTRDTFELMEAVFDSAQIALEHEKDVTSVAMAGVLKNIYAMALGIADALDLGDDAKGALVSISIQEMAKFIQDHGGSPEISYGPAGLGDLVATGHSPHSRNRQFGEALIKHQTCFVESESSHALPILRTIAKDGVEQYPLIQALSDVFEKGGNAHSIFKSILLDHR